MVEEEAPVAVEK
jgi:hypothetical protein